jgi:hypothetical protein
MLDSRNRGMDIASWPWLNPTMRSGFLAVCGLLLLQSFSLAQESSPPSITNHPVGATAYIGESVSLVASVAGSAPLTFQWYKDSLAISGATSSTFTIASPTLSDSGVYHLVATNSFGSAATLPVAIYVTKRPQTITFTPASTLAIAGSGVVLNATSSSALPITFSLVSGAASLSGNILTGSGGNVTVRASQPGNDTIAAAEPVDRTISFVAGTLSPFITSPPPDQTVTAGTSATFRATAIGTPAPTYQWQKDGAAIAGATTPTLTVASTTLADAGRYTIVATNAAGTANASATLTVRAAPVITSAPNSQTVFAGERASFTVAVTGVPSPTFQWRKNGTPIAGATNATLAFASASSTDAARYDVVISNALGSLTSNAATLTVNTRDFSGTYFGTFAGTAGEFALYVRADRSAVFLGALPGQQTGITAPNIRVDLAGNFSTSTVTLASASVTEGSPTEQRPATAAAPQTITLRGTINDVSGTVTGTVPELNVTFEGTRVSPAGEAAAQAGFYQGAVVGTASGRSFMIVGRDAQTFALVSTATAFDAARGTLDAAGHFLATTPSQVTLDLNFNSGLVNGTVRTPAGSAALAGAIEGRAGAEHIVNLSVRTVTSPGAATLIAGFVVTGTSPKQVLIRAAGPAIGGAPFNVAGALPDPTLQLYRGNAIIAQNDEWGTPAANTAPLNAATTRAGAFPFRAGSADAALLTTLAPGPYSVAIGGGTGIVLAEIYEVLENNEPAGSRRLVNVSARGFVSPATPFIAGFVITGSTPQRVLIRGVGPTLAAQPFNVAGTLPNPQLTVFRGSTAVKTNDDWFRDSESNLIRDAAVRAGAFALGATSPDAAMLIYLEPGAYTVQVSGPANANQANSTGLALLEIYEAP